MKKVLIVGADGQLAFDLIESLKSSYLIIKATHIDFDVVDFSSVLKFIERHKPQVVINTAAFHNTLECEQNPNIAFLVNAIGAYNVAKAAAENHAKIMFISSDYIFDGSKKGFLEDDKPNPLNIYGASKLAGECLTKIANKNYFVIRTTGLYGEKISGKGHNFVSLMLDKAKTSEILYVVNDQFCSPTYSLDLARSIKQLLDCNAPIGIYHLVNKGYVSWYQFAKKIFQIKKMHIKVLPKSTNLEEDTVRRPKYSVLRTKKLNAIGLDDLRPWNQALLSFLTKNNPPLK